MEKDGRVRQATYDIVIIQYIRCACWMTKGTDTHTHTHTLGVYNTSFFSTAKVDMRTCLNVVFICILCVLYPPPCCGGVGLVVEALTANSKFVNMLLYCDCEFSVKSVIFTFVDIWEEDVGKVLYFSVQTFFS